MFLPALCEKQRVNPRRAMIELLSSGESGGAAPGPMVAEFVADAPASAPSLL